MRSKAYKNRGRGVPIPPPIYYRLHVERYEHFRDITTTPYSPHKLFMEVVPGENLGDLLARDPHPVTEALFCDILEQMASYAHSLAQISSPSGEGGSLRFDATGEGFEVQEDAILGEGPFQTEDEYWEAWTRKRLDTVKAESEDTASMEDKRFLTLLCFNIIKRLRRDGGKEHCVARRFGLKDFDNHIRNYIARREGDRVILLAKLDVDALSFVPLTAIMDSPPLSYADVEPEVRLVGPRDPRTVVSTQTQRAESYLDALHERFAGCPPDYDRIQELLVTRQQLLYNILMKDPEDDKDWLPVVQQTWGHLASPLSPEWKSFEDTNSDTDMETSSEFSSNFSDLSDQDSESSDSWASSGVDMDDAVASDPRAARAEPQTASIQNPPVTELCVPGFGSAVSIAPTRLLYGPQGLLHRSNNATGFCVFAETTETSHGHHRRRDLVCGAKSYPLRYAFQTTILKAALASVTSSDVVEFRIEVSSRILHLLLPPTTLFAISDQLHNIDAQQAIALLFRVLGITVRADDFLVHRTLSSFHFVPARQRSALLA